MMPELVILQLPEQTKTWNLLSSANRRPLYHSPNDRLNIGKEKVRQIASEDLGKSKICMRFVPHALTTEQKQERVVYCQVLLVMGQDERFWENISTGDEKWCFAYDPATK